MSKVRKLTLCLDFDGVIHSYTSGWKGPCVIPDNPVPGAIMFMSHMLASGWDVNIHSSRSGYWGGRKAMRNWLRKHSGALWYDGLGYAGLEQVKFPLFKPAAFISIDDRAIQFTGSFPEEIELRAFKPWNKK